MPPCLPGCPVKRTQPMNARTAAAVGYVLSVNDAYTVVGWVNDDGTERTQRIRRTGIVHLEPSVRCPTHSQLGAAPAGVTE